METTIQELWDDIAKFGFKAIENKKDYYLQKEKQIIIDSVNQHDEKCVKTCNEVVKKIKPSITSLFEYSGEEGDKYYNEKYGNE